MDFWVDWNQLLGGGYGNAAAANGIWLRNRREIGLQNARRTGGWCIQVLVQGGPSDMQIAEESMAQEMGVAVIKVHCDHARFSFSHSMKHVLASLTEAMKTKPVAVTTTVRQYVQPVAVVAEPATAEDFETPEAEDSEEGSVNEWGCEEGKGDGEESEEGSEDR